MKPLTTLLAREKIKYRWQAFTKVQVIYKGTSLIAQDIDSAVPLLEGLGLEVPENFCSPSSLGRERTGKRPDSLNHVNPDTKDDSFNKICRKKLVDCCRDGSRTLNLHSNSNIRRCSSAAHLIFLLCNGEEGWMEGTDVYSLFSQTVCLNQVRRVCLAR